MILTRTQETAVTPSPPDDLVGPRWEYKTLSVSTKGDDRLEADLNRLGMEGWEAITYGVPQAGPHRIVLKRRL